MQPFLWMTPMSDAVPSTFFSLYLPSTSALYFYPFTICSLHTLHTDVYGILNCLTACPWWISIQPVCPIWFRNSRGSRPSLWTHSAFGSLLRTWEVLGSWMCVCVNWGHPKWVGGSRQKGYPFVGDWFRKSAGLDGACFEVFRPFWPKICSDIQPLLAFTLTQVCLSQRPSTRSHLVQ